MEIVSFSSNRDPFHLIERDLVSRPVVGASWFVCRAEERSGTRRGCARLFKEHVSFAVQNDVPSVGEPVQQPPLRGFSLLFGFAAPSTIIEVPSSLQMFVDYF